MCACNRMLADVSCCCCCSHFVAHRKRNSSKENRAQKRDIESMCVCVCVCIWSIWCNGHKVMNLNVYRFMLKLFFMSYTPSLVLFLFLVSLLFLTFSVYSFSLNLFHLLRRQKFLSACACTSALDYSTYIFIGYFILTIYFIEIDIHELINIILWPMF